MRRLLFIPTFVAMFVIANASPATNIHPSNPIAPSPAVAALATPSTEIDACGELSAARPAFDLQPKAVRSLIELSSLSMLPLKMHHGSAEIVAAGHVKFRHASNAPPLLFC